MNIILNRLTNSDFTTLSVIEFKYNLLSKKHETYIVKKINWVYFFIRKILDYIRYISNCWYVESIRNYVGLVFSKAIKMLLKEITLIVYINVL